MGSTADSPRQQNVDGLASGTKATCGGWRTRPSTEAAVAPRRLRPRSAPPAVTRRRPGLPGVLAGRCRASVSVTSSAFVRSARPAARPGSGPWPASTTRPARRVRAPTSADGAARVSVARAAHQRSHRPSATAIMAVAGERPVLVEVPDVRRRGLASSSGRSLRPGDELAGRSRVTFAELVLATGPAVASKRGTRSMVRWLRKPGDLLARSDLCLLHDGRAALRRRSDACSAKGDRVTARPVQAFRARGDCARPSTPSSATGSSVGGACRSCVR